jgi:hypothetical protein
MGMIRARFSPYAAISPDSPLFRLAGRRRRAHWSPNRLLIFTLRWLGMAASVLVLAWALVLQGYDMQDSLGSTYSSNFLAFAFVISIPLVVLMDFRVLIVTSNSIAGEVTARRWDVLRLTPISSASITRVLDAIGQLRVWRFMTILSGLRATIVVLVVLTLVFQNFANRIVLRFEDVLLWMTLALFATVYVLEPFWRMRALVALGLWLSSRFRNSLSLVLVALGSVFAVWLSQVVIIGTIFGVMVRVPTSETWMSYLSVLLLCALTGLIVYAYYRILRGVSLRAVERRLERLTE